MNEKKEEDVPVSSGNTAPTHSQFKTRIEGLSDRRRREFAVWDAERDAQFAEMGRILKEVQP